MSPVLPHYFTLFQQRVSMLCLWIWSEVYPLLHNNKKKRKVHTLSSMFFELSAHPRMAVKVKVPPLYFSIFVPLYIESLYSHTVQWTFQLELGNMCGQPILPSSGSKDTITSSNRLHLKIVMQIASSDIFPALDKEDSPKVSSSRAREQNEYHRSWLSFNLIRYSMFHD